MSTPNTNRPSITARDQLIIAGIQKHLMNVQPITLNGVQYTPATLIALFQSQIDSAGNVGSLKAKWRDAVKADRDLRKQIGVVLIAFREFVRLMFTDAQVLADFGFTPRKTAKTRTAAEKVVAAAKRAATRLARHTVGPKKKLETKGILTGPVVIEPSPGAPVVTTSDAPAPAAVAPAASAGNSAPQSPPAPASPGNASAPPAPHT